MNLYIFNETRPAAIFGVGTYIRELTMALRHSNINVNIVNLKLEKPQIPIDEIEGIRYWYFPAPIPEQRTIDYQTQMKLYHRNIVYLLQLQIADKKNLIFLLNYIECKPLSDALQTAFDCKIVLVVHYLNSIMTLSGNISRFRRIISQTDEPMEVEDRVAKESFFQEKDMFHAVDKIICLSNHTFDMLHQDYLIAKEKMVIIYNGLNDMVEKTTNIKILQKKWHFSAKEKIILFVGRIIETKGVSFLIKAFREVLIKCPNCRLMIAGNGSYDTYLMEAKDICTKITFTGLLEKKDLYELYSIADIGVMPSFIEQCNYVAIEMMMHDLPMITNTAPGLAEMTEEGISSLQVPILEHPNKVEIDTDFFAEKMLFLLRNSEERKRMGTNARKRYEQLYLSEMFRKNMINFLKSQIH